MSGGELVVTEGATLTTGTITATSGRVTLGSGASLSAVAGAANIIILVQYLSWGLI